MSIRENLLADIDIETEGEYAEHGETKLVMYRAQADRLAEILRSVGNVGDGITSPFNANDIAFAEHLARTIREANNVADEVADAS